MKRFLLLALALAAATAGVQAATYYGFKVGGVAVNSDNYLNVTGEHIKAYSTSKPFSVSYDPGTKTLVIENVKIERTGNDNRSLLNESCNGLKVLFKGVNYFTSTDCSTFRFEANTTLMGYSRDTEVTTYGEWDYKPDGVGGGRHGNAGSIYVTNAATLTIDQLQLYPKTSSTYNHASDNPPLEGNGDETLIIRNSYVKTTYGYGGCIAHFKNLTIERSDVTFYNASSSYETGYDIGTLTLGDCMVADVTFSTTQNAFVTSNGEKSSATVHIYAKVPINAAHFPDRAFRNWISTSTLNDGGYLVYYKPNSSSSNPMWATAVVTANDFGIADLTGIEWFPWIRGINVTSNHLTALPSFEANPWLKAIACADNQIGYEQMKQAFANLSTRWSADDEAYIAPVDNADHEQNFVPTLPMVADANAKNWKVKQYNWVNNWRVEAEMPTQVSINADNFPDEKFRNYLLAQSYGADATLTADEVRQIANLVLEYRQIANLEGVHWLSELKNLIARNNQLTALDLRRNPELEIIDCNSNKLTSLNVSGLKKLLSLDCRYNQLTALTLGNNPALTNLYNSRNQLKAQAMNDVVTHLPYATGTTAFEVYDNTQFNEGNVITQGQIAEAISHGFTPKYYTGSTWLPYTGATDFPLVVGGTQVTAGNAAAITGQGIQGKVTYDTEANILTLENATLTANNKVITVGAALPGLTIRLVGDNTIKITRQSGIAIDWGNINDACITGPGTLNISLVDDNYTSAALWLSGGSTPTTNQRLTIKDCTLNVTGNSMINEDDGDNSLTFENATVHMQYGHVSVGYDLQLVDCYISKPEGGHVNRGDLCAAGSNSYFTGEIEILPIPAAVTGDIDGSGVVDVDDLNIIINMILNKVDATAEGDLNNDGNIDVDDLNLIINIILGKA
ncbi:MAG: hypothetical protein IJT30_03580 [Muribaculaceae bacterium]|nr:hypothetical protein [Muribaculaceae bacterium]